MPEDRAERGPRGKYARLICHACRSRKIKCLLPNPDEIGPLGIPQVAEKSCERCRSFNTECIVERTVLGRPAAKRARRAHSQVGDSSVFTEPEVKVHEAATPPSILDIEKYIYSEVAHDNFIFEKDYGENQSKTPGQQDIFESMIEPASFFASVMASSQTFGCSIAHATSRWHTPLVDLISNDLVVVLDECLVWHRFFLLQVPTLVNMRDRLSSDPHAAANSATNLLFASLCLLALEMPNCPYQRDSQLMRTMQLAVSAYGQEFVFSPPTHRDSVTVSLLLSDYKPTALVSWQSISHRAIRSGLYVNLAYRIAERLELLPTQLSFELSDLEAMDAFHLESYLADSLQGLHLCCRDAFQDGLVPKPLRAMQSILGRMKSYIDMYQKLLKSRQCSPKIVYHVQAITGTYIMMESLTDMKQGWNQLDTLSMTIEKAKEECLEQTELINSFLADSSGREKQDEVSAVHVLLEMHFHSVFASICGGGLFYAMVSRAKLAAGDASRDPEIGFHEAVQLGTQVIESFKDIPCGRTLSFSTFLDRFGAPYPEQLQASLAKFIQCTETLTLDGVAFHPPSRYLVREIVFTCKNMVENNIIQLKGFGRLRPDFDQHLELFAKCAQKFEAMTASPWKSIDAAFASGCLYAAGSKVIHRLCDLMERLRKRISRGEDGQEQPGMQKVPTDSNVSNESGLELPSEGLDLWPCLEGYGLFESLQNQSEWFSALSLFPELEPTSAPIDEYFPDKN
ncbi:hypothetical protein EV356DRAFT_516926 [Viridothelium virens]|uniref:Zn(2)-C6 fungal-type domain-containing protein n=1 Tax=Viridothelium virens TaxID=1048519 RepID=A0A6A6H539_VIRVR|nr:hypothetical protein EV356DRAFT_516926 [Viridothelium virens]